MSRITKESLLLENERLKLALEKDEGKYISIEIAERNFCVGKKQIGSDTKYTFVCTCRNKGQAERLVEILNNDKSGQ